MDQLNADTEGDVLPGRWVAAPPPGTTLVLFGLRVNRWGRPLSWLPLVRALRRMVAEAQARPDDSGLLWARQWRDGRVFTVLSYWRDYEGAMAWAQDARFIHRGVWRRYNRGRVGDSGDVGLWHEVIAIDPDRLHTMYRDMDRRGLAAATRYEDATEAHLRKHREPAPGDAGRLAPPLGMTGCSLVRGDSGLATAAIPSHLRPASGERWRHPPTAIGLKSVSRSKASTPSACLSLLTTR